MSSPNSSNNDFLKKLSEVTETNLTNPQFGVSMLAKEMGMGRHNLHRKVSSIAKITVSQFINQVRLKKAKEILRHTSDTVSEVAYKVGFSNVSYFIKCFHEYYGYSPGEVGKREEEENNSNQIVQSNNKKLKKFLLSAVILVVLVVVFIIIFKPFSFQQNKLENKIAILPLDNFDIRDSSYSTEIDGIIQNIIINLSKLNDIRISPWQSVLQYRNNFKPAPLIAKERKVNYVIKPSVQSIQGKITLSLDLIDGPRDKLLDNYNHKIDSTNETTIHLEFIKEICDKLNVSITPEEQSRINRIITSNRKANKHYWKGVEFLNLWYHKRIGRNNIEKALSCFINTLEYDSKCASAYAQIARIYFIKDDHFLDPMRIDENKKEFSKKINYYADKAYFYDSQLDLSLIAKALYYYNEEDYKEALQYLELALENSPNSILAIRYLSNTYDRLGESEKFIEYSLMAISLSGAEINGSLEYDYLQLAKAFRNFGFFNEALKYLDKTIDINPDYNRAKLLKSQLVMDLRDYEKAKEILTDLSIKSDDSFESSLPFLCTINYLLRDYAEAQKYYEIVDEIIEKTNGKDYGWSSGRRAIVCRELGENDKAEEHINKYYEFAQTLVIKRKSYRLLGYYSFKGDTAKAIEQMNIISQYSYLYYHICLFEDAPLYDNVRNLPEFQKMVQELKTNFNQTHERIKASLEEKELLDLEI
ncbi:MAG: helix-turn-helix domain-containing protein [Bacteroidota bacterium]